jgi:hypothetical protein
MLAVGVPCGGDQSHPYLKRGQPGALAVAGDDHRYAGRVHHGGTD